MDTIWPAEDDDSILIREVYARYGLAMYMAQVLEHAMVNALLIIKFLPTRVSHIDSSSWESSFDLFYTNEFEKTFGNILRTLQKTNFLPDTVINKISSAKIIRDELAHKFFRENATNFLLESGRIKMITYCEDASKKFREADEALEEFCQPYRVKYGMSDEWVQEKFEEMVSENGD